MGMGVTEQVRKMEMDAYSSFLKLAAVTGMSWERDDLCTKLRRELHISNDDHMLIKEKLTEDDRVRNMREAWTQREIVQAAKKARVDAGVPSGGFVAAAAAIKSPKVPAAKTPKTPKTPKAPRPPSGPPAVPLVVNDLLCKRVQRFWEDEGGWFDAIITDYRPTTNEHCLTYEINTPNETFEWANVSTFDGREFKFLEGDLVNIADLKFFSQGIRGGEETQAHNTALKATQAAVGTVNNLVKKVTKTADPEKISEAKGTLTAQEEALRAQLAALDSDTDSDED